ncbi:glycosyltransferase [Pontiellaceae bacterium B12227]|nr:glycosyltransferase [Pontiellaceae bacterium B12227]
MTTSPSSLTRQEPAPVLISVYDRREHLQRCIAALLKNPEASKTTLYIVSDGAKDENRKGIIEEIRDYICSISGFKKIETRFREKNWGMRASALDAIDWVFSKHDSMIRMEDDIVCSPHYLTYLNSALETYKADKRIFCICAHTHPHYKPPANYMHDVFLWRSFSPWGFAIWKDRWEELLDVTEEERKQLNDPAVWKAYCRNRPILSSRKNYIEGLLHNDARINLHMFLTNTYGIYPNKALSINSGMDGTGAHCGLGWTYPKQLLGNAPIQFPDHLEPSKKIHRKLYRIQYSLLNHGIGGMLRSLGFFDTFYAIFRGIFGSVPKGKYT